MRRSLVLVLALAACRHVPERFDSPDVAARYFAEKRGITADVDINARYRDARAHAVRMAQTSVAAAALGRRPVAEAATATQSGAWQFLGPGNVGGRTRALLIDPHDPDVMYAGAVSGGVWKTTDGGQSWAAVTDFLPNLAVNSLAFDPDDSAVIYAGTGEGYFREDVRGTALPIRGNGIFVSRDRGATWQHLPSTDGEDFYWVNDLAVSAHDSRRIYAATRNGVFRSRDGGATWTRVLAANVTGGCLDLAFRGGTANDYLFAACGTLDQGTVYRAAQAEVDDAWTAVLSEPGMGRTSLAVAPSNPSVVYALAARNGGELDQGLFALFRSSQSGDPGSWSVQTKPGATADPFGPLLLTNVISAMRGECESVDTTNATNMGWHCNVVAVDPLDADRVWAAGVDLLRSDDGGRTWGLASYWWTNYQAASYVHADQHVIAFHPAYDGAANQTMLVTGDGGVFRTDNARAAVASGIRNACFPEASSVAFRSLSRDFGTTQFYHGAPYPDGATYLGGAQDNGTVIGTDGEVNSWRMAFGGDGGYVAIDPVDPSNVYAESQFGRIVRSTNGGLSFLPVGAPRFEPFIFIAPFLVDPNRHLTLWLGGGRRLWRNDFSNSAGWAAASSVLPSGMISAVAVAFGGRTLFGTSEGAIHRGTTSTLPASNAGWPSARPRGGWVSSLTFDPANSSVAYATYAGFGGTHVWKTTDAGATWTPLDGSGDGALPDIPAHSMAIDGPRLYLGTDLGIFVSIDGGTQWAAESTFPRVITEAVVLGNTARGRALFAFTHGRGAWRVDLEPPPRRRAISR
ncbi:MAG: hypothetical protein AABO58_23135 [Acidobacteriota bacterium]